MTGWMVGCTGLGLIRFSRRRRSKSSWASATATLRRCRRRRRRRTASPVRTGPVRRAACSRWLLETRTPPLELFSWLTISPPVTLYRRNIYWQQQQVQSSRESVCMCILKRPFQRPFLPKFISVSWSSQMTAHTPWTPAYILDESEA